jgi:hypothetical protein
LKVINKSGKIIFEGDFPDSWTGQEIPINRIRDLTFGQWLDEADYFIYENKDKLNENTNAHSQRS